MNTSLHLSDAELKRRDLDHLRLLAIFHFVFGGLALLGIGFIFLHYFIMHSVFGNPQMWKTSNGGTPPPPMPEFMAIITVFYILFGLVIVVVCVLNVLSGIFLLKRKNKTFSFVVGAINCLQVPFGTILGIFTIIVLQRESVKRLYEGPNHSF